LDTRTLSRGLAAAALAIAIAFAASAWANDILDDWNTVTLPPKPELKAVRLDGSTTALLIMDMSKACNMRPRCVATVRNVHQLHDAARAAGAMLWYSSVGPADKATPADFVDPSFGPRDGEWVHTAGDKFLGTNLEEKLKARKIQTVIVCGTTFQGAGISAAAGSAQRGYKVVVPIDCLSSEDTYSEQYAAWHLYKGGPIGVTSKVTLTRSTMVKFAN